jgi:single-strand DNA-binding protein
MSMTLAGLARLGNEPTVRRMADNKAVMDLSLAFSFGRKVDGKQPVTWISATMWGDRCDKLKPYLVKGQLLFVTLTEIHIEEYKRRDGTPGTSLRARLGELEFAGGRPEERQRSASRPKGLMMTMTCCHFDSPEILGHPVQNFLYEKPQSNRVALSNLCNQTGCAGLHKPTPHRW